MSRIHKNYSFQIIEDKLVWLYALKIILIRIKELKIDLRLGKVKNIEGSDKNLQVSNVKKL